jgi:ketosteroid isomerase-like protein
MTVTIRTIVLFAAPLAALALLGACQQAAPPAAADTAPDTAKVATEVKAVAAEIIAAYNANDAKKTASYDAPDYLGLNHGIAVLHGEQADADAMAELMKDPANRFTLGDPTLIVAKAGDMAVFNAPYDSAWTDPKSHRLMAEKGTWIAVFTRQGDGTMKLSRSIGVDSGPAAPAA